MLFAFGSLFLLVGVALATFNYLRYAHAAEVKPSEENLHRAMSMIDQSSAEEIWDMWHMVLHHGLGEYEASPFVTARKYAVYFSKLMFTGGALIVVGFVLCFVALFMPGRAPAR